MTVWSSGRVARGHGLKSQNNLTLHQQQRVHGPEHHGRTLQHPHVRVGILAGAGDGGARQRERAHRPRGNVGNDQTFDPRKEDLELERRQERVLALVRA